MVAKKKFSDLDQRDRMEVIVEYAAEDGDRMDTLDEELEIDDESGPMRISVINGNYWKFNGIEIPGYVDKTYAIADFDNPYQTVTVYKNQVSLDKAWHKIEDSYYTEVEKERVRIRQERKEQAQ